MESNLITYRECLKQALREALTADELVFMMDEDVDHYGGAFAVSKNLLQEFGPERIMDTPLSEAGFTCTGIGAALGGMRTFVEIMNINISLLALDQIANNAATLQHMSGGKLNVPLVIRMSAGLERQLAAQHSHSLEPLFAHIPGLNILSAGTHEDARHLLGPALADPDPVIIFEYTSLLNHEKELPNPSETVDISKAKVRCEGKDISLIPYGTGVYKCLDAAAELALNGIDSEVIDLRVLRPLDDEPIMNSVAKTNRAFLVEDASRSVSISSEISSRISEKSFYDLDAPVQRLCGVEVPIPYPKHLEDAAVPQPEQIVRAIKKMLNHA
ncbi:alpha-ketoacid dehydrogenase subunit beta [Adhaeribacter terreus]|uniref:Alpha-ketoacid dehydrogenase subunit beta n=1 Tax=Adhaeribacter terreus TaxID=529703 RepID=A0ABW0E6S5_9BACT